LPNLVTIDFIASEGIGGGVDEAGDSTNLFDPPFKLSVCWSDLLSGLVEDAELGVSAGERDQVKVSEVAPRKSKLGSYQVKATMQLLRVVLGAQVERGSLRTL
jgi:hypothetical protein